MTDWIDSQRCWLSVEPLPGYAPDRNPLEQIARTAGDSDVVVSATRSENTVRFYLGRRFQPMADPLAELFERFSDIGVGSGGTSRSLARSTFCCRVL